MNKRVLFAALAAQSRVFADQVGDFHRNPAGVFVPNSTKEPTKLFPNGERLTRQQRRHQDRQAVKAGAGMRKYGAHGL